MSNEVKEIALEQVSGGMEEYEVTEKRYNLDKGDTFSAGNGRDFYVVNLTAHGKSKDDSVECSGYIFTDRIGKYQFRGTRYITVKELIDYYQFLGNGIINASNII